MQTHVLGLMGDPVEHSLSPLIHNTFLGLYNVDAVYLPIKIAKSNPEFIPIISNCINIRAFNVTMPHKRSVLPYCESLSDVARIGQSVNAVVVRNGKFHGYSTDGEGLLWSLERLGFSGNKVVMLGCGGVVPTCAVSLISKGYNVELVARDEQKLSYASELIKQASGYTIKPHLWKNLTTACCGADLLINATPLGMTSDFPQLDFLDALPPHSTVLDMLYMPTKLVKKAKSLGLKSAGGLGMLLGQALLSFELFTGIRPGNMELEHVINILSERGYFL